MHDERIKVMIVDDSALVRQVVSQALNKDPGIEVIATASDPIFALEKMKTRWPDVLVIDIEMPRMDGLTFLRKIMAERPTPTVVCSSLAEQGAHATLEALGLGAVAIITKPKIGLKNFLEDAANDIVHSVRAAARANLRALGHRHPPALAGRAAAAGSAPVSPATHPPLDEAPGLRPKYSADVMLPAGSGPTAMARTTDQLIAIGTSTGGTQALEAVLTRLPATTAGIVVVQHMPEKFTAMFAQRLDGLCAMEIREAQHGDRVIRGRVLIAPGGRHMMVKRNGAQYVVDVVDGPLVNRHKPSVDVLFRSVARFAGSNALGIIMTGMGDDGARGLKEMRDAGANTIAQDEASCVVFGMPKEAIKLGGAEEVMGLLEIPEAIDQYSRQH